jgi:D-hexose-6-phosphate mutarotase
MNSPKTMDSLKPHEIPGKVTVFTGAGGLPAIRVETEIAEAEIYPHGAHVTAYQRKGGAPLLFMSAASDFESGKPIRGGVPLIYPWFGGREGHPAHGIARITDWDLTETSLLPDGSVRLIFQLPGEETADVRFIVTVGSSLTMEFTVANNGSTDLSFENCLHTYFHISDIHRIEAAGLKGAHYLDTLTGSEHIEQEETIRFSSETDRIYQNTEATTEIRDPELGRTIVIRKSGSKSTVVWNPWIEKSKRMPDFGDDEWQKMVCVESGNVKEHAITLKPGEQSVLKVEIRSVTLG